MAVLFWTFQVLGNVHTGCKLQIGRDERVVLEMLVYWTGNSMNYKSVIIEA